MTAPADPGIKRAKPAREKTMSKYRLENVVVDTDNASKSWDEMKYHDGNNWISKATGSQRHTCGTSERRSWRLYTRCSTKR